MYDLLQYMALELLMNCECEGEIANEPCGVYSL